MVNAAKRMRGLSEKLYRVLCGAGSIKLPTDAAAKMTKITMRVPTGTHPDNVFYLGARRFWHEELRRLKYHNPALKTEVETATTTEQGPCFLTVEYESTDRQALERLNISLPKPLLRIRRAGTPAAESNQADKPKRVSRYKSQEPAQEPSTNSWIVKARELGVSKLVTGKMKMPSPESLRPIEMTPAVKDAAPKDEIVVKSQPLSSSSQPQSVSSPTMLYSRTLTLPLAAIRHTEIWNWLRQHTDLPYKGSSPEQKEAEKEHQEMLKFLAKADKDRQLVRAGFMAKKKEENDLKAARAAVEANANAIA